MQDRSLHEAVRVAAGGHASTGALSKGTGGQTAGVQSRQLPGSPRLTQFLEAFPEAQTVGLRSKLALVGAGSFVVLGNLDAELLDFIQQNLTDQEAYERLALAILQKTPEGGDETLFNQTDMSILLEIVMAKDHEFFNTI